jgi:hypothetical protein
MATIHQYFETDFDNALRLNVTLPNLDGSRVEGALLYDFSGYCGFLAIYVPGKETPLDYYLQLMQTIQHGKTQISLNEGVKLPRARQFPGELKVENVNPFNASMRFFGDPKWVSIQEMSLSKRVFVYSESQLSEEEILKLKEECWQRGLEVQFRSDVYATERSRAEGHLAFISHDSRDKEDVARPIAVNLQKMRCPVWYDDFSLKVGDNLRHSIETGLKNCKKCIIVLSANFFSNNGWTKKEFDSIFTRELLEDRQLVLPIWYRVSKQSVYEYSPSLLLTKGLDWDKFGEEQVTSQLYRAIMDD